MSPYTHHRFTRFFAEGDARNAPEPIFEWDTPPGFPGKCLGLVETPPGKPDEIAWALAESECVFGVTSTSPYIVRTWVWRRESAN